MPHFSFNVDFFQVAIFLLTITFLLRDRYKMVERHDEAINKLTEKLTEVSDKLIALTAEFHSYLKFQKDDSK